MEATPVPSATPTVSKPAVEKEEAAPEVAPPPADTTGPRIRREKPVRAVEPRERRPWDDDLISRPRQVQPTFDLSPRADRGIATQVKRMENRWQDAIRNHDVDALRELLAEDFVGTSSTGRVGSKSTLLSELRRDKNVYTSVEASRMSVRTAGDDTAIVTGITREAGTTPSGQRFRTARRFTDTWVKRAGIWRCIASQTTDL